MPIMFRIGEFSKFSRVSIKMLRHYDDIGLLVPAHVDPHTGYRYYTADQLPRLNRIVALKDVGFSLDQISQLLNTAVSDDQLRGMLRLRRAELQQELDETAARLAQVDVRLKQLDEAAERPFAIVVRPLDKILMACATLPEEKQQEGIGPLFEALESYVASQNARAAAPPLMLYAHGENREITLMVPIKQPIVENGRFANHVLPGHQQTACLVHTGPYSTLPEAYETLIRWISAHQFQIVGPTREVFLRFGADQQTYTLPDAYIAANATEFVTELQIPIK